MRLTGITTFAAAAALMGSVALAQDTPATVVDIIVNSDDHATLESAVVAAGMAETLSGEGPFTIFAPTDEAFAALPEGALDAALAEESKDTLKAILGCHALASKAMAADVIALVEQGGGSAEVTTVGNCRLTLTVADGTVRINDAVTVTAADLVAGNGVVHVIDGVLMPAM
ncbi:fasciclin domain-containing protein [Paracoccus shandongensis]|uniref:fasciclin domain-containing protein n=1 Tax=Paracoccus shandongensis TaxID=2816048 RepID=UPI001A8DAFAC|nr:fasciclin domain-containing protein [Paracoccus shandongensis]